MASTDLTLVLSGHLYRPESGDLRSFWCGFIELQKKLPTGKSVRQIVAHSWNPDLSLLVQVVYAPQAECHENQTCFYTEFVGKNGPPNHFDRGLGSLMSTWDKGSLQLVLSNAHARARAVQLMDELALPRGQVLITTWDLGQVGGAQANQIVADATLPEDYLYMPYTSEIDQGYADTWILAAWSDARRFGRFDAFVLDSLAGRNRYLDMFLVSGWPRALAKTRFEVWWSRFIQHRVYVLVSKLVQGFQNHARKDTLLYRVAWRLVRPVQRCISQPPITAENSCVPGLDVRPPVFPALRALDIRALLKFFIQSEGLRPRIRFLTNEDFDLTVQSGQLINPTPIVLFVHDSDDSAIANLLDDSPLPLDAVYQMDTGNIRQYVSDRRGGWGETVLRVAGSTPRDLLAYALEAELRREAGALPVLVMPTIERYIGCTDWFYMSALLKYLIWNSIGYVGLASSVTGKPCLDFPDLQLVQDGGAFSLRMAAGTLEGLRGFLHVVDPSLNGLSDRIDRMQLEFLLVMNDRELF